MGRSLCLLLGLTACLGCGIDDGAIPDYFVDVAPRLGRSCLPCHLTGDARRPSFASLEGVRAQASLMLLDVQTGRMPPGGIDLDQVERELIRQALDMAQGNKSQAARLLGLTRHTLLYRLEKHGFE